MTDAPLKPQFFLVLLSLTDGPCHGYRIKKVVEACGLRLDPGSLYRVIARLLEEDLVAETSACDEADSRRRTYELTARGRATLVAEADRMARLVNVVRGIEVLGTLGQS